MTAEEYEATHPELDWEYLFDSCLYAVQQLHVAELKEEEAPCSATEHRSMAYRRLKDAMEKRDA